ncbi:hypothetical protein EVAR_20067_1 [Eumeta japonica]|uniref:Uncharacterized protein n=1 Tax=Eumeta variegata TaxID=151549 RepID=A0A4C1UHU0_EUMVA|nr:hypothetical protein EVAR_20067_1 [Eumeta japonica]
MCLRVGGQVPNSAVPSVRKFFWYEMLNGTGTRTGLESGTRTETERWNNIGIVGYKRFLKRSFDVDPGGTGAKN